MEELKAAYAAASAEIYEDLNVKILITELCLSNVGLAVRYRADVFGDDEKAVGDFIGTALSGADMLMHNAEELLRFGGYFDVSPEREARAEEHRASLEKCNAEVSTVLSHVISIADSNVVPDYFLTGEDVPDPRERLYTRMAGLAPEMTNMLLRHDLRVEMLENMVRGVDGYAEADPDNSKIYKAEAENIRAVHKQLLIRRIEIETFAGRMQPNPFA